MVAGLDRTAQAVQRHRGGRPPAGERRVPPTGRREPPPGGKGLVVAALRVQQPRPGV